MCYVSQPTLSMQLKKLEEYLQVQLIERNNKNIMLTPAGLEILKRAKDITYLADEIVELAKTFQNPFAGDFKIAAFPTLAPYYFPKIISNIVAKFPDLKLFLVEDKTANLIDKLKDGRIDAAFLAMPVEDNILDGKYIFSEDFYLASSKNHEISNLDELVKTSDIQDHGLMLLEEGHCLRDQALDVCNMSGVQENKTFRATSLETLRYMVASNLGVTLIPELAVRDDDNIIYHKMNTKNAHRKIGLYWRKDSARYKLIQELIGTCL